MNKILVLHRRFCDYSITFKGNTPRTIKWFKECVSYLVNQTGAGELSDLTRELIEDWIFTGKRERDWSAQTIRNRLICLNSFFKWLIDQEYISENPVAKIPRPKVPKRIPRHLTKEQAMELLEWAQNYPYDYKFDRTRAVAIIATFLYTGIRREELRNLQMHHVDLSNRTLVVRSGKGEKDRMVPLNTRLIEFLEDYLKDRRRLKKCNPYFFSAMRSDKRMGELVIPRLVHKIRQKSGIHFYPHLLRHTFATLMLEGGCNIYALSKMLGHSDIKTTTIYLAATTAHLQEQIMKHPLD